MIIVWRWDDSLQDLRDDPRLISAVSELLRSHRLGNHLLVAERRLCQFLVELPLIERDQSLLRRLSTEYTQTGRSSESVSRYIKIVSSFEGEMSQLGSEILMPLGCVESTMIVDKPVLLVENLKRDGGIYKVLLKAVTPFRVEIDLRHGGGGDILDVFSHLADENRIVVAVVDSDRATPRTAANPKLSRLTTIRNRKDSPLVHAFSPPCRELENIIPVEVLTNIQSAEGNAANQFLSTVADREDCSIEDKLHYYFDIKNGILHGKIASLRAEEKEWILGKMILGGIDFIEGQDKDWTYVVGYGDRVVDQILRSDKLLKLLSGELQSATWKALFESFFSDLSSFFVSAGRLAA